MPSFHTIVWAFIAIAVGHFSFIPVKHLADIPLIQVGSGWTLAVFEPKFPTIIPTSDSIFDGFVKTAPTWGFAIPSFVEVGVFDRCFYNSEAILLAMVD